MYISQIKVDGIAFKLYKCRLNLVHIASIRIKRDFICMLMNQGSNELVKNITCTYNKYVPNMENVCMNYSVDKNNSKLIQKNISCILLTFIEDKNIFTFNHNAIVKGACKLLSNLLTNLLTDSYLKCIDLYLAHRLQYGRFSRCISYLEISWFDIYRVDFPFKGENVVEVIYYILKLIFPNDQFIFLGNINDVVTDKVNKIILGCSLEK